MEWLNTRFSRTRQESDEKTEAMAGVTAFLSMAYILIVIPALFSRCGMDFGGVYLATALTAALGTLILGLTTDFPAAVVPSVGINTYLGYSVILSHGCPWQSALGAVMAASLLLAALSLTRFPTLLLEAIPHSLLAAVRAGFGLFLAFSGLTQGRLIIGSPTTVLTLGDFSDPAAYLTALGLVLTAVLLVLRIHGAVFLGLLLTEAAALLQGFLEPPEGFFFLPAWDSVFFQFSLTGLLDKPALIPSLAFLMLVETTGAVLALHPKQADNLLCRQGLTATAAGGFLGSVIGTGAVSMPPESAAGIAAGGRGRRTTLVIAALFFLSVILLPAAKAMASMPAITAPALILAGLSLMESVAHIDWNDPILALPSFFTMILMPYSYSIVNGIGAGILLHVLLKTAAGEGRTMPPLLYLLAGFFLLIITGIIG